MLIGALGAVGSSPRERGKLKIEVDETGNVGLIPA